MFNCNFY